jgi:hypothetical protein
MAPLFSSQAVLKRRALPPPPLLLLLLTALAAPAVALVYPATAHLTPYGGSTGLASSDMGVKSSPLAMLETTGGRMFVGFGLGAASIYDTDGTTLISNYIGLYDPSSGAANGGWSSLGSQTALGDWVRALATASCAPTSWAPSSALPLFVGGSFASAGGTSYANGVAAWDGANWTALGRGVTGTRSGSGHTTNYVNALLVYGNYLYVAGCFSNVVDSSGAAVANTRNVARWDLATGAWSAIGTPGATAALSNAAGAPIITAGSSVAPRLSEFDTKA